MALRKTFKTIKRRCSVTRLTKTAVAAALVGAVTLAALIAGCSEGRPGGPGQSDETGNEHIVQVTGKQQFQKHVLQADKPVLVDFFATWCPPCKLLAPILRELSHEYADRAEFVKVDVDQSPELPAEYGVRGYPTVLIFAGGKPVTSLIGLRKAAEYRTALDAAIAGP